ncbi:MAG: dinucleotide-utilizing enzyme involved in molybdopterin and thiamine biosynthesis family 2 [Phycisphaerales bacterium]|nr:dinucleotide-utilizing enzyme involved in molybdopterin and thiamine biosynthesis family 2 [Phycisphaerales bacterium]
MPVIDEFSKTIREAFELVQADPHIEVVEPPHELPDGDTELRCRVEVQPFPNPEGLPQHAILRIVLDRGFPLRAVDVFAEDAGIQAFPHQDAETGKLCLFPDRDAPFGPARLKVYIDWARQWLADAATGQLLIAGDPYELPDFSRRNFKDKLATDRPLLFDEDAQTFASWAGSIGTAGAVELVPCPTIRGFLTSTFRAADNSVIRSRGYPENIADPKRRLFGRWILLPTLMYYRHRPPQKIGELNAICAEQGIDLLRELRKAWEQNNENPEFAFLLVGYPIPMRVGDQPTEIHWQPLYFFGRKEAARQYESGVRRNYAKIGKIKTGGLWSMLRQDGAFAPNSALPWGRSENISRHRLYARGGQSFIAAQRKVVLAGCGALGSVVAELISRGGAADLTLFDGDRFEMGNQCRHTLDGSDLGLNKADALARRLQLSNPLSLIRGFGVNLPLLAGVDSKLLNDAAAAIDSADLIIDCTTDEGAFRWLDGMAVQNGARLTSMFVNFRAQVLTLGIAGRNTSCRRVCRKLYQDVLDGHTPITRHEYDASPQPEELVYPGAGCWHPTFPAANSHLWMLASVAVDLLNEHLKSPIGVDGVGMLIRRNGELLAAPPKPIVEIIWNRRYR